VNEIEAAGDELVRAAIEFSDRIPLAAGLELTDPRLVSNHLSDVIELLGPHEVPPALHFALDDYIAACWDLLNDDREPDAL
jgi:hypothetical protein